MPEGSLAHIARLCLHMDEWEKMAGQMDGEWIEKKKLMHFSFCSL